MDQVVEQVGKKGNCTYCGVFRRQALDRGAAKLGVRHVVTGHNADDVAETVLMNLLRGDLPRLARTTSIVTSTPSSTTNEAQDSPTPMDIKRSKPLLYAYEKEIVMYAYHNHLDYFSTECIYSPEAFRGSARALIKNLEKVRPSAILDVVRSGIEMAKLVRGGPDDCGPNGCNKRSQDVDEEIQGCGSSGGKSMVEMDKTLKMDQQAAEPDLEIEISSNNQQVTSKGNADTSVITPRKGRTARPQPKAAALQTRRKCVRCGHMSSQAVCKACVLLEGLNKSRAKTDIDLPVKDIGLLDDGVMDGLHTAMSETALRPD